MSGIAEEVGGVCEGDIDDAATAHATYRVPTFSLMLPSIIALHLQMSSIGTISSKHGMMRRAVS